MLRFSIIILFCLSVIGCSEDEDSISNGAGASNYPTVTDDSASNRLLTKCSDCGKDVSKRAVSCPHCGAPLRTKSINEALPFTFSPATDRQDESRRHPAGALSSFEELCNTLVSAIKNQDPEKLVEISYFPSLRNWNDYVTKRTDELEKDPDTALIAKRARLQNTLDPQSHKSLEMLHEDAIYESLKDFPYLRHASYVAEFLTKGSSAPAFRSVVESMTFKIKTDDTSFWGPDRYFATVLVSIENVLVSIQFVACVDGDKNWWLCSDKFVVQFATETFLQSLIAANKYEIQHKVSVRDNSEAINKALMFLAAHPTPLTHWDWFNINPKSYKRLIEVGGVVTYDGKPLADATIVIYPDGGDGTSRPADGKTDAQGNFSLTTTFSDGEIMDGAFKGSYRLFVVKYEEMELADDQGGPPEDGGGTSSEMFAMMGDNLDLSSKSLINEKFGGVYSTDKDWNNRFLVGANESPATLKITLSSDGVGKIVVVTK